MSEAGSERFRLFVALELTDEVRDALGRWTLAEAGRIPELRRIASEHLHVTLCFLGWQPADAISAIGDACQVEWTDQPPALSLGESTWLPPRRPRALAVRLVDEGGRLAALQSLVAIRLQAGGWYVPERRDYMAHVTVARVRRGARVSAKPLPNPPELEFAGSRITLFRSRLRPAGAQYEPLVSVDVG